MACRGVQPPVKRNNHGENDSETGLLLLDPGNLPVYANSEAIRILVYPEAAEKVQSLSSHLATKVRSLVINGRGSTGLPQPSEIVSGRRRYLCRVFDLAIGWNSGTAAVAVLIERTKSPSRFP